MSAVDDRLTAAATSPRQPSTSRVCLCGARLARDNTSGRCSPCQAANRYGATTTAPDVPADFWDEPGMSAALRARHIGHVIRAWRNHPAHGRNPFPQQQVAEWLGITQGHLSRIEHGTPVLHLDALTRYAQILHIPQHRLWFTLPDDAPQPGPGNGPTAGLQRAAVHDGQTAVASRFAGPSGQDLRSARESAGVGLGQLAAKIGRSKGHLSRVETGSAERHVTPALIHEYERALGIAITSGPVSRAPIEASITVAVSR